MSLLPRRGGEGAVGVRGFFSTWLKCTEGLLLSFSGTYGTERASLGDEEDSSDCPFLHLNVQHNQLHGLHSYLLVRGLLEA